MGFFNLGIAPPRTATAKSQASGCAACSLSQQNKSWTYIGNFKSKILFIGDYPSRGEAETSTMRENTWRHLWNLEGRDGLPEDFLEEFAFTYAVPCPCPEHELTVARSQCCEQRLSKLIQELKPIVIIPMGIVATQALLFSRLKGRIANVQASEFYGKCIPDRHYNAWICPTYDPDFASQALERMEPDRCPITYMRNHIIEAYAHRNLPFPIIPTDLRTTLNPEEAATWIEEAIAEALECDPNPKMSIDYETTGIKPHRPEQRIVAGSLAWKSKTGYRGIGFKWDASNEHLINAWHSLFKKDSPCRLIAHKADFETCWTHFKAGLNGTLTDWPENWDWDTCIGAHVINNNQKVGLKFHTYVELGILGYDEDADPYMSQTMPGENAQSCYSLNRLADDSKVPWMQISNYCGQDSLYTLMIRDIQHDYLVQYPRMFEFFNFFLKGMVVLSKVQSGGLPIDMSKVAGAQEFMLTKKREALEKIAKSQEAAKFTAATGELLNPASNAHLLKVLYDIMKIKPPNNVRDARVETLEKINTQFCKDVLELRHYTKMAGTFLDGYTREAMWDEPAQATLIRPFFNLSTGSGGESGGPRTYRSSADSPNFQNIPKRDKEMKKMLRNLFVAPPGYRFVEADYKSLEVMISASYHHDPNMIKYLCDETSDMHRDTAADMYMKKPEEITKLERQSIKMGYVFSSFYGASYKHCAERMWENMPDSARENLASKGVDTYPKFLNHVRDADAIFWNQRFAQYNKWRKDEWQRYQTNGYVEGYLGCRCYGPMSFTETANRCIQGSGFHTLLQALIWDIEDFERLNLKSRIIGQIHDALVLLVKEEELDTVREIIHKNGVTRVQEKFDWIAVPLVIEAEASKVTSEDGSVVGTWAEMEELGAW